MAPAIRSANPGNGYPSAPSCLCSIPQRDISFGGWWGHTLFRPLYQQGPERDAVHVVFTAYSTAHYVPTFADAAGLVRQVGMGGLPRLNHFVAMSPDRAAEANALAVQRFEDRLRSATDTYREAVAALNVAKQNPDQEKAVLRGMMAQVETVPLASSKAAAKAEEEAHDKCREEEAAERKRKEEVAQAEARARSRQRQEGSGDGDKDGEAGVSGDRGGSGGKPSRSGLDEKEPGGGGGSERSAARQEGSEDGPDKREGKEGIKRGKGGTRGSEEGAWRKRR
ncbi:hypothetical protein Esi_0051_0015 [Ectocarpus siliculosus]|uniref:Uncharacterized protein n=1 Tax=Ectocarpus siliculosus TaxID=2880 RepID=D7G3F5_ECTSI|nr:hypothetical protein Esi_0051_0015 [Ectocarpus siliculosus]|eukprot:CBJ26953.1 hypothetical protein Esi_0051_0015 [Ectocarpus siliculosus]